MTEVRPKGKAMVMRVKPAMKRGSGSSVAAGSPGLRATATLSCTLQDSKELGV